MAIRDYNQLQNRGGTIYSTTGPTANTTSEGGYRTPADLALDLGTSPDQIQWARLPQLNAAGQASYAAPVDPIGQFNMNLMKLLQNAQGANSGNAALLAQRGNLQNAQTVNSMKPAGELGIAGLAPGDALRARGNAAELYNPEVRALNDRIQLNNEAVTRFEHTIEAAKAYGEEMEKYIKPSEQTIEAVRQQLRSGSKPSESVLEKVGKYLTEEDWNAWADANSKTSNQKDYELAKSQGFTGTFQQWVDRNSDGGGTVSERQQVLKGQAISKITSAFKDVGGDGFLNPNLYREMRDAWGSQFGDIAEFYKNFPIENYVSSQNRTGDLSVKSSRSL